MKIGMNMLLWATYIEEDLYPTIEKIKSTGYDGIEIPIGEGDVNYYRNMGKLCDKLDLRRTSVTSLFDDGNPVSPDPSVRKTAVEQMRWRIDMAAEMGSEVIGGPFHSAFASFSGHPPTQEERNRSAQVLHQAAEYAATHNIVLTPEALNRFECYLFNTMDDISELIKKVDHPNLRLIYDTHHAHIEEKNVESTLKKHGDIIAHVHISESDRGTPGNGQVRWEETFANLVKIGYDGWLTIEAFSRNNPEFASGINVWRNFEATYDEIFVDGFSFIKKMWKKYAE